MDTTSISNLLESCRPDSVIVDQQSWLDIIKVLIQVVDRSSTIWKSFLNLSSWVVDRIYQLSKVIIENCLTYVLRHRSTYFKCIFMAPKRLHTFLNNVFPFIPFSRFLPVSLSQKSHFSFIAKTNDFFFGSYEDLCYSGDRRSNFRATFRDRKLFGLNFGLWEKSSVNRSDLE